MESDEQRRVTELRSGSVAAFDAIYREYRIPLFSFLYRLCGKRELAEDLFQNTWLKLARGAAGLQPDSDLKAWLFTVARNEYRSYGRWRRLDLRRALSAEADAEATPPVERVDLDSLHDLTRCLLRISTDEREVLLLVTGEGFEPRAAAAILGISYDALRQRLARARSRLSKLMEELDR